MISTGEKSDGKYLQKLIEKSKQAEMKINTVIGDAAYSEKANMEYTKEEEIALVAKLNPILLWGNERKKTNLSLKRRRHVCM